MEENMRNKCIPSLIHLFRSLWLIAQTYKKEKFPSTSGIMEKNIMWVYFATHNDNASLFHFSEDLMR